MPWYLDVVSKNMLTQKIRNQPSCINSLAGHDMRPAVQHDRCRRPRKVYGSKRELLRLQIQNADSSSAKGAATATKKKNNTETRSTKGKRNGTVGHWGPGEGSRFCWDNPMLDFVQVSVLGCACPFSIRLKSNLCLFVVWCVCVHFSFTCLFQMLCGHGCLAAISTKTQRSLLCCNCQIQTQSDHAQLRQILCRTSSTSPAAQHYILS